MNGLINVYKEAGFTSMDVVAKLRGILKTRKIGHTGTLDPDATGVLPVCVGYATKLCDMLTDRDKEYVAELLLGVTTDTLDISGQILATSEVTVSAEQIREAVSFFVGGYDQIPPMYSALKINGQKLCDLARNGKEVERKPRHVEIYSIDIEKIELPVVTIRVHCGKGTYIRSLCDDIGRRLGCGGCMRTLVRTKAAGFEIDNAYTLSEIEKMRDSGEIEEHVTSVEYVFRDLPAYASAPEYEKLLQNGNPIGTNQVISCDSVMSEPSENENERVRIYHADGRFCGVFTKNGRFYKPEKIFEL